MKISLMTTLSPGQSPPQVTIAALTYDGLKCKNFLGPARSHFLDSAKSLSLSNIFFSNTYEPLYTKASSGRKPCPPKIFRWAFDPIKGDLICGICLRFWLSKYLPATEWDEELSESCMQDDTRTWLHPKVDGQNVRYLWE